MHLAQKYLVSGPLTAFTPKSVLAFTLSASNLSALSAHLEVDSCSYLYSSAVSFGEAISSLQRGSLSWATVKFYYSTFYSIRSLLATSGVCLFYYNSKPFLLDLKAGENPKKGEGPTHKIILNEFVSKRTEPILISQLIELESPVTWMMKKREEANYINSRFIDPIIPDWYKKIIEIGVRRSINAYVSDALFAFDPDHAIVAYPITCIKMATSRLRSRNIITNEEEKKFLKSLIKDPSGPLTEVLKIIS